MPTNNAINLSAQGMAYYNGTGAFSAPALTQFGLIVGAAANDITNIAVGGTGTVLIGITGANPTFSNAGTTGTVLIGNTAANPSFSATASLTNLTVTNLTLTNPLTVANGGTGDASFPINSVIISGSGNTTSPFSSAGPLTNGQVVIGSTGNPPVANTLTAGSGVSITNGAGTITIALSGSGGVTWNDITVSSTVTIVANNGYLADAPGASPVIFVLPAAPTFGDTYFVTGRKNVTANTGGWEVSIASASTQSIIGGTATAVSNVTSTNQQDSVTMVCTHASGATSQFTFIDMVGNMTFT